MKGQEDEQLYFDVDGTTYNLTIPEGQYTSTEIIDEINSRLTAAESRIRDVDMADEMVEYAKHNILQNATQAIMAQINDSVESVVQLLQM